MRSAIVLLLALGACGGDKSASRGHDAAVAATGGGGSVGPVTPPSKDRVGGAALAMVDDTRAVLSTQALVDLAVEAPGYDAAITTRGLRLGQVPAGTILARLGLLPGDVIDEVAGVKIERAADLQDGWLATRKDGAATIVIERGGQRLERRIFLAELLGDAISLEPPPPMDDAITRAVIEAMRTGVRIGDPVTDVDPRVLEVLARPALHLDSLRDRFREPAGVQVDHASPLAALGLTRWDVIKSVGADDVSLPGHLIQALARPLGGELTMTIFRVRDPIVLRFRAVDGLVDGAALDAAMVAWDAREAKRADDAAALQAARDADPATTTDWDKWIRKIDDTHYEVDRKLAAQAGNPMAAAKGARVVPAFKNGQSTGLKLYAIRPSSIFSALGLANGDTIHSVNGKPLLSLDDTVATLSLLKTARKLEVEITRRGKPMQLEYKLR